MSDDPQRDVTRALDEIFASSGERVALNGNGLVTLGFDGDREITLEVPQHSPSVFAHGPLMTLSAADREATLARALEINMFDIGLPQAWIALDARTSALTLCASRPVARMDATTLGDFLQAFLDCMNGLGRRIRPGPAAVDVGRDDLADLFVLRI